MDCFEAALASDDDSWNFGHSSLWRHGDLLTFEPYALAHPGCLQRFMHFAMICFFGGLLLGDACSDPLILI